jgi:hypothetical protein
VLLNGDAMIRKSFAWMLGVVFSAFVTVAGSPSRAADGQVLITHAKAVAGGVTPGDAQGYPVALTVGGSYILGSDLTPPPNFDAIVVGSSDTTIDLNGFKISGGPAGGSSNARYGIWGKADRLTVKNGTITGFTSAGIYAPSRQLLIVENMRLTNNLPGLNNTAGVTTIVRGSMLVTNRGNAIVCGYACHVEGNVVSNNVGIGVVIISGTLLGNTILSNGSTAIYSNGTVAFANNHVNFNNNGNPQFGGPGVVYEMHSNLCGGC